MLKMERQSPNQLSQVISYEDVINGDNRQICKSSHKMLESILRFKNERKTGTPVFPTAFVQEPKALETSHELIARGLFQTECDSCVGEAQTGFACLRRHANLLFARISRSRARRRKKNAIQARVEDPKRRAK